MIRKTSLPNYLGYNKRPNQYSLHEELGKGLMKHISHESLSRADYHQSQPYSFQLYRPTSVISPAHSRTRSWGESGEKQYSHAPLRDLPRPLQKVKEEEAFLSSLNRIMQSDVVSLFETIRNPFLKMLSKQYAFPSINQQFFRLLVNGLEQGRIPEIAFRDFLDETSTTLIDLLVTEFEEGIETLKKFKNLRAKYTERAKLHSANLYSDLPREGKSSEKSLLSSKKRRSQQEDVPPDDPNSEANFTELMRGGKIIPLDIKAPTLTLSPSSKPPSDLGSINSLLSVRQDMQCSHCGTKVTPEWRRGLDGNRTLCNACGLFYMKLIRKYDREEAAAIMKNRKQQGMVKNRRLSDIL